MWRQVLTWDVQPALEVGDRVEIIATPEQLEPLGLRDVSFPDPQYIGKIQPELWGWRNLRGPDGKLLQGIVEVEDSPDVRDGWCFPYSHWQEYMKVVE